MSTISSTTVRANGSSLRGYLAVFTGALVLTATVTVDAPVLSAKSLSITITAGSISDVQRGYRVVFSSSGGAFKGESHVRWGGTLNTTNLPVREFSESEFLIVSGDVVQVFALIGFEDKLVENTELFDPDGVPVGTYQSAPPPLACSGGLDAGFVDGYETAAIQTYRTIVTDGSQSIVLDPTSTVGHLSHLWTLPSGVAFQSGSTSADVSPTLQVNQGQHTVYHDVTDTDNSQTWRQCVTYQVFDATHLPIGVIMESAPTGDPTNGWSCTFRATDFLDLTAAPDGALVAFFVRERINGSWQSLYASSGRAPIKLVGYLTHDESDITAQLQIQRFQVISPLARLGLLPGFSKILIQNATPNDWSEMLDINTTRAMVELIRIYTFALDGCFDLNISILLSVFAYPELWLQTETPLAQVNELVDGVDGRFTCTRTGIFRLDPNPPLLDPVLRVDFTTVYTFTQRDVARLVARRDHIDTQQTLELHATTSAGSGNLNDSVAVFSRSPGSPGHGSAFTTVEKIIVNSGAPQFDTQTRGARRYAMLNKVYTSSTTGQKMRLIEIDVYLRLTYDFLDFDDQIVQFSSFPNPRDVDLTAFLWTLVKTQLDYTTGQVMHTFQTLTDSPMGTPYYPPADPQPPSPPTSTIPTPIVPSFPIAPTSTVQRIALISTGGVNLTQNFQLTSPGISPHYAGYAAPWSGTLELWVPDGFNPGKGWVFTSVEIGYLTLATGAYTVEYTFGSTAVGISADASFAEQGYAACAYYDTTDGTVCVHRNGSSSWTKTIVNATLATAPSGQPMGIYVSSKVAGKIIVGAFNGLTTAVAYESLNHGGSWSVLSPALPTTADGYANIHAPWAASGDSTYFFTVYDLPLGVTTPHFYRQIGGSNVDITPPAISGDNYAPNYARNVAETSVLNPNRMLMVGEKFGGGNTVFVTNNALSASPTWTVTDAPGTDARRCAMSGDNVNAGWVWGVNGKLEQYLITGTTATITDESGDYDTATYGAIIGFAGW